MIGAEEIATSLKIHLFSGSSGVCLDHSACASRACIICLPTSRFETWVGIELLLIVNRPVVYRSRPKPPSRPEELLQPRFLGQRTAWNFVWDTFCGSMPTVKGERNTRHTYHEVQHPHDVCLCLLSAIADLGNLMSFVATHTCSQVFIYGWLECISIISISSTTAAHVAASRIHRRVNSWGLFHLATHLVDTYRTAPQTTSQ